MAAVFAVVLGHVLLGLLWRLDLAPPDAPAALPPLEVRLHEPLPLSVGPLAFDVRPQAPPMSFAAPELVVEMEAETLADPIALQPPASAPATAPSAPATPGSTQRQASTRDCWPFRWLLRLSRTIDSALRYPADARRRNERGTALVRVNVQRSGHILETRLLRSSGHPLLDTEARDVVHRIGRFEPMTPGECAGYDVIVVDQPVRFGR
ncbi:MAG: energy transducer TonB [Panacagrimonas sp.]